jgi:hypothetical protein
MTDHTKPSVSLSAVNPDEIGTNVVEDCYRHAELGTPFYRVYPAAGGAHKKRSLRSEVFLFFLL